MSRCSSSAILCYFVLLESATTTAASASAPVSASTESALSLRRRPRLVASVPSLRICCAGAPASFVGIVCAPSSSPLFLSQEFLGALHRTIRKTRRFLSGRRLASPAALPNLAVVDHQRRLSEEAPARCWRVAWQERSEPERGTAPRRPTASIGRFWFVSKFVFRPRLRDGSHYTLAH